MKTMLNPLSEQVVITRADVVTDANPPCGGESQAEPIGPEGQHAARIHRGKTLLGLAVLGAALVAANRGRT